MKLRELVLLLKNAAEHGAMNALSESGQVKEQLTKAEAYRLYGRGNVDRWITEGLISPIISSDKAYRKYLERSKLEAISASSNRITYLQTTDR